MNQRSTSIDSHILSASLKLVTASDIAVALLSASVQRNLSVILSRLDIGVRSGLAE